jgi:hypothetical protein
VKKIISFSVYGSNPKYANAAIKNIKLQPSIYPGWTCRIYHDESVPRDIIEEGKDLGAEMISMPKAKGHLGMFWRFEPLKDLSIERFIVRDSDSRLNVREAAAVKEWEESGKEFHIMRDHPQHGALICGGMWGATNEFIAKEAKLFDKELEEYLKNLHPQKIFNARGMYFNTDQPWLWQYIWPKIKNSHIAHIKDLPNLRFMGNEKLFPAENSDGSFVGQPFEA